MLPPGLKTPREVTKYYDSLYDNLIDSSAAFPFLYPWASFGAFAILIYLLIDHRRSPTLKRLRFPIFGFLVAFQTWCILTNKAKNAAAAFGVGLISAWGLLWVAAIMVFNDCQTDFARIERVDAPAPNKHVVKSSVNGTVSSPSKQNGNTETATSNATVPATKDIDKLSLLYWQSYPTNFAKRVDWVADVFCSFRGVGWNWRVSGVPCLPKTIESQLHGKVDATTTTDSDPTTVSRTGIRRFSNRSELLRTVLPSLIVGYLAVDALKTLISHDPYFWGYTSAAPPPPFLPDLIRNSHVLTKSYRLLVSLAAIYTALWTIFKLGPLFFCGVLGPSLIGVRGEAWMNPADMFGSFTCVADKGLAGWWGGYWHQTFRFAFEAPTTPLLKALHINKRSASGKAISLCLAFFLSGCLHACGSYTQLGDTRPLDPLSFFPLQAVGILAQEFAVQTLARAGVLDKTPKLIRRVGNLAVVHVWLYFTAPLLVDDFARGGIWLFEPVPISPLRGLGFGAQDDGWFCWGHILPSWRSGKRWWDTGIAL